MLTSQSPYRWVTLGLWVIWILSEWWSSAYFRQQDQENKPNDTAGSNKKSSGGIYVSVCLLILMYIFASSVPRILMFKTVALPFLIVGIISVVSGLFLRWTSIYIMGKSFSRQIRTIDNQEIINTGPFAYIRHPNYLASFLVFLGFGFLFGSWLSLVVCIIIGITPYIYRIRVEEEFLLENLDGYANYRQDVPYRLIPFIY